jgi:hypothetical protein
MKIVVRLSPVENTNRRTTMLFHVFRAPYSILTELCQTEWSFAIQIVNKVPAVGKRETSD